MSKTVFSSKCKVLSEFWLYIRGNVENQQWKDFIEDQTESLLLAHLIHLDAISVKENPIGDLVLKELDETWEIFCEYLGIRNDLEYPDLENAFASRIWEEWEQAQ